MTVTDSRLLRTAAFALVLSPLVAPAAHAGAVSPPSFSFTEIDAPNAADTFVMGFTPGGGTVGFFDDAAGVEHGFILDTSGMFKQVDAKGIKGARGTLIYGHNTAGYIVQIVFAHNKIQSYLLTPKGKYTQIAVPGAADTYVYGINKSGTIVGSYEAANGEYTAAFTYAGGKYTTFREPGMGTTVYSGINDFGTIVGGYQYQGGPYPYVGFILKNGQMTTLMHPGVTATLPQSINNAGEVIGYVRDYYDRSNSGFVYKSGVFTDFNDGIGYMWGQAIDDAGNIAGAFIPTYEAASGFVGTVQ